MMTSARLPTIVGTVLLGLAMSLTMSQARSQLTCLNVVPGHEAESLLELSPFFIPPVSPLLYRSTNPGFASCSENFQGHKAAFANYTNTVMNVNVTIGVCVLKTCKEFELALLLGLALGQQEWTVWFEDFNPWNYPVTPGGVVMAVVIAIIGFIALTASTLDYFEIGRKKKVSSDVRKALLSDEKSFTELEDASLRHENSFLRALDDRLTGTSLLNFLQCFSVPYNMSRLMAPAQGDLGCVNGIRALSMGWVIMGHALFFWQTPFAGLGLLNPQVVAPPGGKIHDFLFQLLPAAEFAVDSFFMMSGFLVTFSVLKQFRTKGMLGLGGWFMYYFHRFWRLSPPYFFLVLFLMTLAVNCGAGPSWSSMEAMGETCREYWWTNFLYINNFHPHGGNQGLTCFGWAWYLANDMQFYIISPLFLVTYWKNRFLGYLVAIAALAVSFGVLGYEVSEYNYSPAVQYIPYDHGLPPDPERSFRLYVRPYSRIPPYLVGIFLGFILETTNWSGFGPKKSGYPTHPDRERKSNSGVVLILYGVGGFLLGSTAFGTVSMYGGDAWSADEKHLYGIFGRFAWAVGLAIVVYLCLTNNGGIMNSFLSASIWNLPARLSYAAYLVHPIVMLGMDYASLTAQRYQDVWWVKEFVADYVFAHAFALIVWLLLEKPSMNLEKLMFTH